MTFYRINAPHFVAGVVVESGVCTQAAPIIAYAVGRDSLWFFDYCKRKGWVVEPVIEEPPAPHPRWFVLNGNEYELHWHGDTLARVSTFDGNEMRDLTYEELPDAIKKLI